MISRHPLDRLVEEETFGEMLALLQPEELIIAFLRLEGLNDDQIAVLLDVDRMAVLRRMELARQRLMEALPEMAPVLRGRRHRPRQCQRPLERGWICPAIGDEDIENGEPPEDDSPLHTVPTQMAKAGSPR